MLSYAWKRPIFFFIIILQDRVRPTNAIALWESRERKII
jgi:hypothetical protein